ncbi:MAG: SUMF1/EgtB/PvdO family nonheme iron enzyme [Spirochaetia bacterium]|jgi:formylglycine-generating enzyme required for sulfatase activity
MQTHGRADGTPHSTKKLFLPMAALILCPFYAFSQEAQPEKNTIAVVAIHAAGDSFTMGDGTFGPGVTESVSSDFSMSKFLITNGQFALFILEGGYSEKGYWTTNGWEWKGRKNQPAYWTNPKFSGPDQPVVGVSWYEAVAFCNWLSVRERLTPAYESSGRADLSASGYRLPTEVEWEYAAAKGGPGERKRIYPWGDTWDPALAVCQVKPAGAAKSANVGSKSPGGDTPQGLADMAGNVWEWCSDNREGDASIARSGTSDRYYFQGDSPGQSFVLRGGSWVIDFPNGLRSAFRSFASDPGLQYNVYGFRVVRR